MKLLFNLFEVIAKLINLVIITFLFLICFATYIIRNEMIASAIMASGYIIYYGLWRLDK